MSQGLRSVFESMADLRRYHGILREQGDIYPINAMSFVVTDYQLTRSILRRADDFRTFDFSERIRQLLMIDPVKYDFEDIRKSMSDWLLFMDGPDHLIWKKRLMQRMYGMDLQGIIASEWEHIAAMLDQRSEFDLMDDLCSPLISRIICSIIGLDPNHFNMIRTFEKDFMKALVPSMTLDSLNDIKEAHSSFRKMQIAGWEDGTLKQARLLHALLNDLEENERAKVMSQMEFMLAAGIESSIMLLTESIFRLLTDLRKEAQMLEEKEERSFLIEELIRMSSPISVVTRKAMRALEIGGHQINEGQIVLLFIACVNRDPKYFPYPDEVNPENLKTPHLAFGLGRHHCMGTELSKMEMNFILPAFMERFGDSVEISPEKIKKSFYTPGIETLHIKRPGLNVI